MSKTIAANFSFFQSLVGFKNVDANSAPSKSSNLQVSISQASNQIVQNVDATKSGAKTEALYGWILHPVVDILFCCGGLVWLFFLAQFFGFEPAHMSKSVQMLMALASLGYIALAETHVMATLERVYKKDNFEKFAPYTKWAAAGCALLAVLGVFFPTLVPIYLKVYLLFVAQHFTAQTFGLTLLYCAKRNYFFSTREKFALSSLLQSTMCVAMLRQLTYRDYSVGSLLGFNLPDWSGMPEIFCQLAFAVVAVSAVSLLCVILRKWHANKQAFPVPAALVLFTGVAVFLVDNKISQYLWLYVPAFFHGSQYIAISLGLHIKEKGLPEGMSARQIGELITEPVALRYLGMLLVAALCFFQVLPFVAGLFGLNAVAVAASTFAAIHFHHFLTDSAIWKLRDPDVRKLLVA